MSGKGRIPAVEVMVNTPTIQDYLLDPEKTLMIKAAIHEGVAQYGMQTFDQSLMKLYTDGLITLEEAIHASSSPTEFELRIRGIRSSSDSKWSVFEGDKTGAAAPDNPDSSPNGMVRF
jgi:twitching motility protein PilT